MDITGAEPRIIRDPEAQEKLIKLRDEFIPTIVASSNLRVYTSVTHCDMKLGYSQDIENHYIEGLGKQFYEDMIDIIQATVQQNFDTETDTLYDEILQHSSLCKTYASFYEYKCEALNRVHKYILPSKSGHINPLIVYGGLCAGNSLLLAEVAKKVKVSSFICKFVRTFGLGERSVEQSHFTFCVYPQSYNWSFQNGYFAFLSCWHNSFTERICVLI